MLKNQIKTHFDRSIILFFIGFFLLSSVILAFQMQIEEKCILEGFKIDRNELKAKELITFSDTTSGTTKWEWNFGDGSQHSYLSKVSHVFEKEGKYIVKLKVNNSCEVIKEINVLPFEEKLDVSLIPIIEYPKTAVVGIPVKFIDKSNHAKSWQWMFGENNNENQFDSTERNPTYVFKSPGLKKITLAVNGNYKYVKKIEVFVKEPEVKKDNKIPVITVGVKKPRGPEKKNVTEQDIEAMMRGISKDLLSYKNFAKYFCKDAMPSVHLRSGKIISLKELDEDIRNKSINIKKITILKDEDGCVTRIDANYKN